MSQNSMSAQDWSRVFAHAWLDPEFKAALEKNPVDAIASHPELGDLSGKAMYFPERPVDLSDEQLHHVKSGKASLQGGTMCMFECC
ncbi:MAG: hypothetical protein AAGJ28_03345 [Pseudomonadota bacterium]